MYAKNKVNSKEMGKEILSIYRQSNLLWFGPGNLCSLKEFMGKEMGKEILSIYRQSNLLWFG